MKYKGITALQSATINAMLTNTTNIEAAREVGVPIRTLQRWLTKQNFQDALKEAQNGVVYTTTNELLQLNQKAVKMLNNLLDDPNQPKAIEKLKIVCRTLELSERYHSRSNTDARIKSKERNAEKDQWVDS